METTFFIIKSWIFCQSSKVDWIKIRQFQQINQNRVQIFCLNQNEQQNLAQIFQRFKMKKFLLTFVVLFLLATIARCAIITNLNQKKIFRSRFVTMKLQTTEVIETPRLMCQSGTTSNPHYTQAFSHMEFDVLPSSQTMKADCVALWDVPNVGRKAVYVMFSLANASQAIFQYAYQNRPPETIDDYLERYARTGRLCDVYEQPTDIYEEGQNGSLYHYTVGLRTVLTQLKLNEWLESYYLDINIGLVQ